MCIRDRWGGLSPDNVIDINIDRLASSQVEGSKYNGAMSYAELLCHEGVHFIQRHAVSLSDGRTENGNLSAHVAEAFYEGTFAAKGFMSDLYWLHPFETEAREKADLMMSMTLALRPDIKVFTKPDINVGHDSAFGS